MFGSNLEPESVVSLDDGLFSLPEQSFSILSIAEDGGSGICTKLWIKKNALLNNTKVVDVLGGKGVESSRGQGVMFWWYQTARAPLQTIYGI